MSETEAKSEKGFCIINLPDRPTSLGSEKKVEPEFVTIPTRLWEVVEIKNCKNKSIQELSLIHISEPTRPY